MTANIPKNHQSEFLFTMIVLNNFTALIQYPNILSEHKGTKGWFGLEFITNVTFCPLIGSDLQVVDVNSDRFDDLICHMSNGTITITESHIVDQRPDGISADTGRAHIILCRKRSLIRV